jgi:hypothetical protein
MKTHLFVTDAHAHPDYNNRRADLVGRLIADIKPDVVINGGDQWCMPSLSSFDKGKMVFEGRAIKADIDAGLEFSDRMWHPMKKTKRRMPERHFLIGNHENRIPKVVNDQREFNGWLGLKDLDLDRYYDNVVEYNGNTPGVLNVDGIHYAHFFVSGVMGRPIGGEHPATSLLTKEFVSCSCGHIHVKDWSERTTVAGKKIYGLLGGCFIDYHVGWAGEVNKLWSSGVSIKRSVEDGQYDLQWISLAALEREYGRK